MVILNFRSLEWRGTIRVWIWEEVLPCNRDIPFPFLVVAT